MSIRHNLLARLLATPVRTCLLHQTPLPSALLLRVVPTYNPDDQRVWFVPDVAGDRLGAGYYVRPDRRVLTHAMKDYLFQRRRFRSGILRPDFVDHTEQALRAHAVDLVARVFFSKPRHVQLCHLDRPPPPRSLLLIPLQPAPRTHFEARTIPERAAWAHVPVLHISETVVLQRLQDTAVRSLQLRNLPAGDLPAAVAKAATETSPMPSTQTPFAGFDYDAVCINSGLEDQAMQFVSTLLRLRGLATPPPPTPSITGRPPKHT